MAESVKRKTIGKTWSGIGDRPAPVPDLFEAVVDESAASVKVVSPAAAVVVDVAEETEFVRRMNNWRRTVRGGLAGGGSGYCAQWAKWYVMCRLLGPRALRSFV